MSTLFLTLMIAFILVILAIAALSIGWLLSGKSKIVRGACGTDPTKHRDKKCGTDLKCGVCEKPEEKESAEKKQDGQDGQDRR